MFNGSTCFRVSKKKRKVVPNTEKRLLLHWHWVHALYSKVSGCDSNVCLFQKKKRQQRVCPSFQTPVVTPLSLAGMLLRSPVPCARPCLPFRCPSPHGTRTTSKVTKLRWAASHFFFLFSTEQKRREEILCRADKVQIKAVWKTDFALSLELAAYLDAARMNGCWNFHGEGFALALGLGQRFWTSVERTWCNEIRSKSLSW